MWFKSRYTKHLEKELERERENNRVLLSALLERAISREAGMMLRKPEELTLSLQNIRERAKIQYEERAAARERHPQPSEDPSTRHWRQTREEKELASHKAAAAANSNDSLTRLNSRLPGGAN